nr:QueT transporter family protein [uncultured Dysosmobacter sp.]
MSRFTTRQLATAGIIAALYTVLSLFANVFGVAYGPIQCRFSEALTVLPFFLPEAVPGLFIGCLVTNLMSTVGPLDIIFGSLATLLAALWTRKMPSKWLAPLPPVLCNAVIIGAMIAWYEAGFTAAFPGLFAYNAFTVGLGEAIACYVLGLLLLQLLPRIPGFQARLSPRA